MQYYALLGKARVARLRDGIDAALPQVEEALALGRESGNKSAVAHCLETLGFLAILKGEHSRAPAYLQESLALQAEPGYRAFVAYNLAYLAWVAAAMGRAEEAARLLGAAEANHDRYGGLMGPDLRANNERVRADVAARLGEARFAATLGEGRAMTADGAVAFGLDFAGSLGAPAASRPKAPPGQPADALMGLTEREIEVLRLVAQGLTNAQVAERLVISPVTVNTHLRNIYGKIGVNSRTAAARWAVDHGLA